MGLIGCEEKVFIKRWMYSRFLHLFCSSKIRSSRTRSEGGGSLEFVWMLLKQWRPVEDILIGGVESLHYQWIRLVVLFLIWLKLFILSGRNFFFSRTTVSGLFKNLLFPMHTWSPSLPHALHKSHFHLGKWPCTKSMSSKALPMIPELWS